MSCDFIERVSCSDPTSLMNYYRTFYKNSVFSLLRAKDKNKNIRKVVIAITATLVEIMVTVKYLLFFNLVLTF